MLAFVLLLVVVFIFAILFNHQELAGLSGGCLLVIVKLLIIGGFISLALWVFRSIFG